MPLPAPVRQMREILIVLFCVWHCSAVSLYLLTNKDSAGFWSAREVVSPYILLLSQWQMWNIFSPDPLRRVSSYRIDTRINGIWKPLQNIDYDHLRWPERAKELKILERLEDSFSVLVPSYLQSSCTRLQAEGKTIRLVARSTVLPALLQELITLRLQTLLATERVLGTTLCASL